MTSRASAVCGLFLLTSFRYCVASLPSHRMAFEMDINLSSVTRHSRTGIITMGVKPSPAVVSGMDEERHTRFRPTPGGSRVDARQSVPAEQYPQNPGLSG